MEISTIYPLRYNYPRLKKIMLVMKLTIALVTVLCMHLHAATFGQNITIADKNAKLEKILNQIEKQSGYTFWYNTDLVKNAPKVTLDVKNYTLERALETCFQNLPITYKIVQQTIVLTEKKAHGLETVQVDPIVITGKVNDDLAKAAAAPPDEPPGVRLTSCGLTHSG